MSFETLFILGALTFVSGALATLFFYFRFRRDLPPQHAGSFARYFGFAAVVAFLAYFVGSAIGIYGGCSSPGAGNLCGIWGALGVGPLFSGLALWVYGPLWKKRNSL